MKIEENEKTVEEFAKEVYQAIVDNTYPYFDKDGKPVNIWKAVSGFDKIDKIYKKFKNMKRPTKIKQLKSICATKQIEKYEQLSLFKEI